IEEVVKLYGGKPMITSGTDRIVKSPPENGLSSEQAADLQKHLDDLRPAVLAARKLSELPRGRWPMKYDEVSTKPAPPPAVNLIQGLNVAKLLALDAIARAQQGDGDGALDSCLAIQNIARSTHNEPTLMAALVRRAATLHAV